MSQTIYLSFENNNICHLEHGYSILDKMSTRSRVGVLISNFNEDTYFILI